MLQMALKIMDFLTMSILPIYEHIYLSIYLNHLPFIQQCPIVVSVQFFTLLVKCTPKYFIVFDTIGIEIVLFISFSDISLLVYKNVTDFYMLFINYRDTL